MRDAQERQLLQEQKESERSRRDKLIPSIDERAEGSLARGSSLQTLQQQQELTTLGEDAIRDGNSAFETRTVEADEVHINWFFSLLIRLCVSVSTYYICPDLNRRVIPMSFVP